MLSFRAVGYDGQYGTSNKNYFYLKRASDGAVLLSTKPPLSNTFTDVTWDVSTYKGVTAYLEVVDNNNDSGFAWLGIDHVVLGRNDNFERGNFTGWTATGTAFGTNPITSRLHEGVIGNEGRYWADSFMGGESSTGSLRGASFMVQKPVLAFRGAGFDGQFGTNGENWFYLKRASDGAVLKSGKPPQGSFRTIYWDVSAYIGTSVYFEAVDGNDDSGYAWLAFDDVYQLYNFDFENAAYGGWTTTGTAFGGGPLATGHADMGGWRGLYHADSFAGGEAATGTLRSADFILEESFFTFLKAGYDGQNGNANQNFYYLKRASDGAVLFSAKPPQSDRFVAHTWDVSSYAGTKVYFEVVDGVAASGFAWLAVDDINWRGLGPKSFTVQTSTDAVNWSTFHTVTSQGNQAAQYAWSPVNARYVRLNVTSGYNGNAFIKEVTFSRPVTAWTIVSAAASSQLTGFEAGKTIDGIVEADNNYWSPSGSFPHTLTLDLGSAKNVTSVDLFSRNNMLAQKLGPQSFDILVSVNGTGSSQIKEVRIYP
ncbi:discoidin domain-containing protein [Cohnella sp. GCM10012308]|uniref:discoidin domain-containing protein n=1 Tax=Cohnella sp. GCM10012308 TaxID=3317329 RepID=UPI003612CEAA